jgi:hypothetical protein
MSELCGDIFSLGILGAMPITPGMSLLYRQKHFEDESDMKLTARRYHAEEMEEYGRCHEAILIMLNGGRLIVFKREELS